MGRRYLYVRLGTYQSTPIEPKWIIDYTNLYKNADKKVPTFSLKTNDKY